MAEDVDLVYNAIVGQLHLLGVSGSLHMYLHTGGFFRKDYNSKIPIKNKRLLDKNDT